MGGVLLIRAWVGPHVGGGGWGLGQTYTNADGALGRRVRGAERDVRGPAA